VEIVLICLRDSHQRTTPKIDEKVPLGTGRIPASILQSGFANIEQRFSQAEKILKTQALTSYRYLMKSKFPLYSFRQKVLTAYLLAPSYHPHITELKICCLLARMQKIVSRQTKVTSRQ